MSGDDALGIRVLDVAEGIRRQVESLPDDEPVAIRAETVRAMADLLDAYGRRLLGIGEKP